MPGYDFLPGEVQARIAQAEAAAAAQRQAAFAHQAAEERRKAEEAAIRQKHQPLSEDPDNE
jgi:hypothetical protein